MSFFDSTPIGRVLNRFTTDIDQLDDSLPSSIDQTLFFTLQICGTIGLVLLFPLLVARFASLRIFVLQGSKLFLVSG